MIKGYNIIFGFFFFFYLLTPGLAVGNSPRLIHYHPPQMGDPALLAKDFRLLVWNIQKLKQAQQWAHDFDQLIQEHDFILLQESVEHDFLIDPLFNKNLSTSFARTFVWNPWGFTGVSNSSPIPAHWSQSWITDDVEPIAATPKASLAQIFSISPPLLPLMIINTHSLNFVRFEAFKKQIWQLLHTARLHQGPLIWAGDFNTWSSQRLNFMDTELAQIGLTRLVPHPDPRFLKLDHIWTRGCTTKRLQLLSTVTSSDHFPLSATMTCQSEVMITN